jgi:hypothetical protein
MLRNEGIFAPLRLRTLWCTSHAMAGLAEPRLVALAADLASHTSLTEIGIFFAPLGTPAALDALVDAALTLQLSCFNMWCCGLSPASAPALARLLGGCFLRDLMIDGGPEQPQLLDTAACLMLSAALRTNSALTVFALANVGFWREPAAACELLRALSTHRDLRYLRLSGNAISLAHRGTAGAALAEFVAAAPALQSVDVSACNLGDDGLGPLVDALRANTRLRTLTCHDNGLSEAFVRDRLLPAVHANASLRVLTLQLPWASAREAEALVQSRDN